MKIQKVVHACIWFDNKILLGERLKNTKYKGYFSNPGGKVEKGETLKRALIREVKEETGLQLNIGDLRYVSKMISEDKKRDLHAFEIKYNFTSFNEKLGDIFMIKSLEPEKQGDWKFFSPEEALKLKLTPSVRDYLEKYEKN